MILMFSFMYYSSFKNKASPKWLAKFLIRYLTTANFILIDPFVEIFMGIFRCENGYHEFLNDMECYKGVHIVFSILSCIFVILLTGVLIIAIIFCCESQISATNAYARLSNYDEIFGIIYRTFLIIYTTFVSGVFL